MKSIFKKQLTGSEFESVVSKRMDKYRDAGVADIRKSGVAAFYTSSGWQVQQSRPDFEGIMQGPVPIVFDCKACSGHSFGLSKYQMHTSGKKESRRYQLEYMFDKASYGVVAFFLIHWNPRELKTKAAEAVTYAFPVHREMRFWDKFERGEIKSISRDDCDEYGHRVSWTLFNRLDRNIQPDIRNAVSLM